MHLSVQDVGVGLESQREFLTKPFDDDVLLTAIRHAIERSSAALGREAEIQGLRECYASLNASRT